MKSHTWKPERRNRNIGTSAAGHSQSNKMKIPNSWCDRFGEVSRFMERVEPASVTSHEINGNEITVLYEKPRKGFTYGCTPEDVIHVLSHVPGDAFELIEMIIFRQPTHKQARLSSVWGRLVYWATVGRRVGTAIYLEAQEVGASLTWPRKLSLDEQAELARLRADGHEFVEDKRSYKITLTEENIRNTLLYRTLLHELGHWYHYDRDFLTDESALSEDADVAFELYFAQPKSQHEDFAHRYAAETSDKLRDLGVIPFAPKP